MMVQILENRRVAAFLLATWCLALFIFSSIPGNKYPDVGFPGADKLVHVQLYFWLGIFACLYFLPHGFGKMSPVLFGIIYGFSDEFHQLFVPLRTFSLADLVADAAGVVLGVVVYNFYLVRFRYPRETRSTSLGGETPETL